MNLISVSGISKTNGDKLLFKDATFGISEGEKVANQIMQMIFIRFLPGDKIEVDVAYQDILVSFMEYFKISHTAGLPEFSDEKKFQKSLVNVSSYSEVKKQQF